MNVQRDASLQVHSRHVLLDGRFMPATVTLRNGRVEVINDGELTESVTDVGDCLVLPSPVDIHFHGGGGVAVPPDASLEELEGALLGVAFENTSITTTVPYEYLATLPIPSRPPSPIVKHVAAAGSLLTSNAARVHLHGCRGIRLEGCFLNEKRAGVWPVETFFHPSIELFDQIFDAAEGHLRIVDIAPELPNALELIEHAVGKGVTVAIAHTDADYATTKAAIDAGATLGTHTFNAMRGLHHREPGAVGALLSDSRVTCELICDGVHLHPAVVQLAMNASRTVCISDASPFAGLNAGKYDWHGIPIKSDGTSLTDDEGSLAGSASLLPRMFDWMRTNLVDPGVVSVLEMVLATTARSHQILDPSHPDGLAPGDGLWIIDLQPGTLAPEVV